MRSLKGRAYKVPATPPAIDPIPWWQVIVSFIIYTDKDSVQLTCTTVGDIITKLLDQVQLSSTNGLVLRLLRVSLWDVAQQPLQVIIDELVDGSGCSSYSETVHCIEDYPGAVAWARGGYEWPITSRLQSLTNAESSRVIMRHRLQPKSRVLVHLHCLFRSLTPSNPPTFMATSPRMSAWEAGTSTRSSFEDVSEGA